MLHLGHLVLSVVALHAAIPAQSRPNFIVVCTDDQRADALGASGNTTIRTPNLDQMAAQGLRFRNANVVYSLDSPSRAALLTGRYGSSNGVTRVNGRLRPGARTFAQELAAAGYRTAMVGEWNLDTKVPAAGFDFCCYFTPDGPYHGRKVWDKDKLVTPKEHVDAYCVQRSIDFLEAAARSKQPFVLFHNTQLPHMDDRQAWPVAPEIRKTYTDAEMPLPKTWRGALSGKPAYLAKADNRTRADVYGYSRQDAIRKHVADYYAAVTDMDAMLGKLFDEANKLGLIKNTYVIFTSDSGWLLGEHRMTGNILPYAPSMRVPLFITGPGIKPGIENRLALNIDIAPTLLELAGVPVPERMNGKSLVPLLERRRVDWRDSFVYEGLGVHGGTRPTLAACDARYHLIYTWSSRIAVTSKEPESVELYDLTDDPEEAKNLASSAEHAGVRERLSALVRDHIRAHLIGGDPSIGNGAIEKVANGSGARSFSGIYPHLASFNSKDECGTGAVVPWADHLWWLTYAPHEPEGSDDKLYAMNASRDLFFALGSVGGTPANRMIHTESRQLFMGPYAIAEDGGVRVIPYSAMPGRLTGTARHLTDPRNRIYFATMEEGFYDVDTKTLDVKTLFPDTNDGEAEPVANLPGCHGKGLYSGQGVLVYTNNGEAGKLAETRPDVLSGVLAEWDGKSPWKVIARNQFTEITGPGGIRGNPNPATDPLWSIGWDQRSLLLMLRTTKAGKEATWKRFRLPKASHCYDGSHGWNTEWPRIRDIGENDLLMTMHGTFWRFPKTFDYGSTSGIAPRSTYLKVIGDFCRYGDRIVFGCDDAAKSEFLNTRRSTGKVAGPEESQSNLWFVAPERLDSLGPAIGRGGVFVDEFVPANVWSDPFLFSGYAKRSVHLAHQANSPVTFSFEYDTGDGTWKPLTQVKVGREGYRFYTFDKTAPGSWVRVAVDKECRATVWFEYRADDPRTDEPASEFASLATAGKPAIGGLVRAGDRVLGLQVLATELHAKTSRPEGYYELRPDLNLAPGVPGVRAGDGWMQKHVAIPQGVVRVDGTSILYIDEDGARWRLPIGNPTYLENPGLVDLQRTAREVVTERDLFQCGGTFFELPARNAGGIAKIRPIATHPFFVQDYCSWRGLMVLTGLSAEKRKDPHVVRSSDGRCAVWLGTIDDLWKLGKPRGTGGPWEHTPVQKQVPSDPYLMAGYDKKSVEVFHEDRHEVNVTIEVDITGTGNWQRLHTVAVPPGKRVKFEFPGEFAAYWVRLVPDRDCVASAVFSYR